MGKQTKKTGNEKWKIFNKLVIRQVFTEVKTVIIHYNILTYIPM